MDWTEWLLSREFRQFVLAHDLFIPLLFVARVVGVTALEWWLPARKVPYRTLLAMGIIGATMVGYLMIPVAQYLSEKILIHPVLPEVILILPTALLFVFYYAVGDFGAYWVHRLLHLAPLWRMHKWHHSPTTM
jgi:sterol desaturase/sphingolipid hydroxylase (fatty acid hydroxylase superfamily)